METRISGHQNYARATLSQVARRAGVSLTTASLILNQKTKYLDQFSRGTISRVQKAATELGYRSNLFALSLLSGGSSFFGLVRPTFCEECPDDWYFHVYEGELESGIAEVSAEAHVYPIATLLSPEADEGALCAFADLVAGGVFGALIQTPNLLVERYLHDHWCLGAPLVILFPFHITEWESNAIDADSVRIGEEAGRLLALQGRRRWMLVYDTYDYDGQALRCQGFARCAEAAGAVLDTVSFPRPSDHHLIREQLATRFRGYHPDGVFALTRECAVGSLLACTDAGLKVGQDVHLVGCACHPWSAASLPPVTCVDIEWREAGRTALRQLLELRASSQRRFGNVLLEPRIFPGETCPVPSDSARGRTDRDQLGVDQG